MIDKVVSTIREKAKTGNIGDGKLFLSSLEDVITDKDRRKGRSSDIGNPSLTPYTGGKGDHVFHRFLQNCMSYNFVGFLSYHLNC